MPIVRNLNGSGRNFPKPTCGCESWIEHWNINKYPNGEKIARWCRGCRKKTESVALCGGHVIKVDSQDKNRYIIPLCASCNAKDDAQFNVNISDLVSANCNNCVTKERLRS